MKAATRLKSLVLLLIAFIFCINVFGNTNKDYEYYIQKSKSFKNTQSDSLVFYALKAYNYASDIDDSNKRLDAVLLILNSNVRTGDLISALAYCDTIKGLTDRYDLSLRSPEVLLNIGIVYNAIGMYAQSLDFFFQALNQSRSIETRIKIDLYYYLAVVYFNLNKVENSRKYLDLSLNTAVNNGFEKDAIPPLLLCSNLYNEGDSIQKYLSLVTNVLKDYSDLMYEKVVVLSKQALTNKYLGKYNESGQQYRKAIRISIDNRFQEYLSNLYNNYSYLLMAESKYDSADYYLNEALEIAIKINSLEMESEIYDSYSDLFERIGDFKRSLFYSNLFIKKRGLFREKQEIQKSLLLSALYNYEEQEKKIIEKESKINRLGIYMLGIIAILLASIGMIVYFKQKFSLSKARVGSLEKSKSLDIANAVIRGQDDERKRLAMDLHDGLGARLCALNIMFDGFFSNHDNFIEVSRSISEIQKNVRSLSHRMAPPELESLGLNRAINNLIQSLNISNKFSLNYETNLNWRLPNKLETNIYFLVYELINNATIHSEGNEITTQLMVHDALIYISVEDNGKGFNTSSHNEGMGLKNIRNRAEYLNGNFSFESNDTYTLFMIELPIEDYG